MRAGHDRLVVTGWTYAEQAELYRLSPAELAARFAVLPADTAHSPQLSGEVRGMAGRFSYADGILYFAPRFPFLAGTTYLLRDHRAAHPGHEPTLKRPATPRTATTRVLDIYPAGPAVPVNLLRCYLYFSARMSDGHARESVHLIDTDTGELLPGALLPTDPELWDRSRTRLTLLLDPGRIKRGLVPHTETGYPLTLGRRVTLTVDDTFRDATGTPLTAAHCRTYRVTPAERHHVTPARWTYHWPRAHSHQPVRIEFDRPLDHVLALRCLHLTDSAGTAVVGSATLTCGEAEWRFAPTRPWRAAGYTLTIDPHLEDSAGNSIIRVFDRDLTQPTDNPHPATPTTLTFHCA